MVLEPGGPGLWPVTGLLGCEVQATGHRSGSLMRHLEELRDGGPRSQSGWEEAGQCCAQY